MDRRGVGKCTSVAATGIGIADEVVARMFDPFYSTKPIGRGTGFGLPLCKRLIEELGGVIAFDTTPGEGVRVDPERAPPGDHGRLRKRLRSPP